MAPCEKVTRCSAVEYPIKGYPLIGTFETPALINPEVRIASLPRRHFSLRCSIPRSTRARAREGPRHPFDRAGRETYGGVDRLRSARSTQCFLFGGLQRESRKAGTGPPWISKPDIPTFLPKYPRLHGNVSRLCQTTFAHGSCLSHKKGSIVSRILMLELRATWKRVSLPPWPQDAHRHSFISYWRRIIDDAQTALDAGTSETITSDTTRDL